MVLSHSPAERDTDGADEWEVMKCNGRIEAPPDTDLRVCVFREGSVVTTGVNAIQSHYAWQLTPEEIEHLEDPESIVRSFEFPAALRGTVLPVGTHWDDEHLSQLLLPFQTHHQGT